MHFRDLVRTSVESNNRLKPLEEKAVNFHPIVQLYAFSCAYS